MTVSVKKPDEHEQIVAGCGFSALGRHAPSAFRSQSATFMVAPGCPTRTIWLTAASPLLADLAVECHGGSAALIDGAPEDGRAKIGLDAPIDLAVTG